MNSLWGTTGLMTIKFIVVVDRDVDVHDENAVWHTVGANAHPGRDVVFCAGPTHMDDHAAPEPGMGHKMGIDATRKLPAEGHLRPWPDQLTMPPEVVELVSRRWAEYGIDASS
jgi:4-hydroxy-3-polyprenylbenzoate decarboxylase